MSKFHITFYKVYDNRVKQDFKILILSDLHYNPNMSSKKLNDILKKAKEIAPTYIFIPGDFLDYKDVFYDKKCFLNIKMWLKQLATIASVFIGLGNHEYYELNKDLPSDNFITEFSNELNKIKGVTFLNNDSFCNDKINIVGLTLTKDYYGITELQKRSRYEDKYALAKELKELNKCVKFDKTKINFLLVHSPIFIMDKHVKSYIESYDYILSGHMHNGCVPPLIYELWHSDRGIISPNKRLFPKNTRNTLKCKNDKLIVNGPLTMFSKNIFLFNLLNKMFPIYMSVLEITNESNDDNAKVQRNCKYMN